MAAYLIKRIIVALSLFLISPVYSVDCSHCDENDNLADAAVANSMGKWGNYFGIRKEACRKFR